MNLDINKTKSHKIRWTTAWRRKNKKQKTTGIAKKRRRRRVKIQKAIVGMTLDEIKKRRNQQKGRGKKDDVI